VLPKKLTVLLAVAGGAFAAILIPKSVGGPALLGYAVAYLVAILAVWGLPVLVLRGDLALPMVITIGIFATIWCFVAKGWLGFLFLPLVIVPVVAAALLHRTVTTGRFRLR
jgi:hypothetical protein